MRLGKGAFRNFCSYPELEFYYSNQGLTSITGNTGAGKSTFMDAAAWTLYGVTSKDGAADDVRPWGGSNEPTTGILELSVGTPLTVTRIRGGKNNDLYWTEDSKPEVKMRGKDVTETQRLLENRLGVTADLYFTAAYFHQFSGADAFFTANAKSRRDLLEKIADLSLAVRIADGAKRARKDANDSITKLTTDRDRLSGRLDVLAVEYGRLETLSAGWGTANLDAQQNARNLSDSFEFDQRSRVVDCESKLRDVRSRLSEAGRNERERKEIEALRPSLEAAQAVLAKAEAESRQLAAEIKKFSAPGQESCPTCLGDYNNPNKHKHLDELKRALEDKNAAAQHAWTAVDDFKAKLATWPALEAERVRLEAAIREQTQLGSELDKAFSAPNPHLAELGRLQKETNPHVGRLEQMSADLLTAGEQHDTVSTELSALEQRLSRINQVYDLSMDLRAALLQNTVRELQEKTNRNLEAYFDGELKASFTLDGDKLEVLLQKNGYDCSFKQLSGGQRAMLKLSFGTALMEAAANKAGTHFSCLFFDESLNGLDASLKVKAFTLFEKLSTDHESVFMIEHSEEFKTLFSNVYQVTLIGDESTITHLSG